METVLKSRTRRIALQPPKLNSLTNVSETSADDYVLDLYQKMFGKRENNKYTENEIFLVNSKLNASKAFAKYL
jgi:hypothetical protein